MNMNMNIDSDKPLPLRLKITVGALFTIVALAFIPAQWLNWSKDSYEKPLLETSDFQVKTLITDTNADPDGDGVPNWQEALLGTDPTSPNTNGVPDRTKIDQTTNSEVTANTPTLYSFSKEEQKTLAQVNDPNNITGQVAKNSVGLATYLDQQKITDDTSAMTIGGNIYNEAAKLAEAKVYTTADITFAKTETFASIKTYGNTVAALYLDTVKKVVYPNDLTMLNTYFSNKDSKQLALFTAKLAVVTKARDTLLAMSVPKSAAEAHLAVINATESYRNALYSFSQVESDPMRTLVSVKEYKSIFEALATLPNVLGAYFDSKNVVFTPKESGYLFMQAILGAPSTQ